MKTSMSDNNYIGIHFTLGVLSIIQYKYTFNAFL